jgi:hypothetical protein
MHQSQKFKKTTYYHKNVFAFIYVYWYPSWFPYQTMSNNNNMNTLLVDQRRPTLPQNPSSSLPGLSGIDVTQSLVFCVDYCLSFRLFFFL